MADLEHLLLEAAGRTGTSSRHNHSRSQSRRRHNGSYSDDESDSRDDDSDNHDRNHSRSRASHKRRYDSSEKDDRAARQDREADDNDRRYDSDDSHSGLSVGSDLYKDDADREKLSKMSELEREWILSERSEKRDDYWLKKKARVSSQGDKKERKETPPPTSRSGRMSTRSDKSAAKDDALNELRAKRMKQHESVGDRRSRDMSGGEVGIISAKARDSSPMKRRTRSMAASPSDSSSSESGSRRPMRGKGSDVKNDLIDSDEDDSASDDRLKFADVRAITIRRSKLARWFMEPFFEDLIAGCFVRLGIGMSKSGQRIYRLCMVKNVDATEPDRQYKLENKTTHKYLNCVWGNSASAARWQMARVSDCAPLEEEFHALCREVERNGGEMPEREDVLEKIEAIKKINNFVYSAATVKQMLQEKKSASSRPLNVAAEKNRLRKEVEVAKSRGNEAEVERIRNKIKELERQPKQKNSKAVKLEEMNKKNRAENFKNASESKAINTSLKAGEAGYDPFSRRWTRSRNYYVSNPGGEATENAENATNTETNGSASAQGETGVGKTAAALKAAAGAGKLVDTIAPVDRGTTTNMLHNFELPISLAGLQKFGGPQGVRAGFMARKQKLEATFGYKVPENDGRRHPLTLSVGDYKRRRGLL